jgi:hypothetical protein
LDFIELIFQLLTKFVPMPESKLKRLQLDGSKWYTELGEDEEAHPLLKKFKTISEQWYTQVGLGLLFIYLNKVIYQYINAPDSSDEDEGDDD